MKYDVMHGKGFFAWEHWGRSFSRCIGEARQDLLVDPDSPNPATPELKNGS